MKPAYIFLVLVLLALISSASATQTIQEVMTSTAKACPGVGNVVVVQDDAHIGVTISPGQYATSSDLSNAVASLVVFYSKILQEVPSYQGYLRVGIANRGPDGKNHIVQIFEAPAQETRANQDQIVSYANTILGRGKEQTYQYTVDGYLVTWPGPDPYDPYGYQR